jgi:beta-glucuronidase
MVPDAQPWSPDHPVLYTATIALRSQGRAVDSCAVRFGFRRVEAKQDALLLNGEPVLLTGFNRHEDSPARRMCVDPETARADLLAMKRMGASFLRLCHYPQHPSTLDLCDELGLLAMCEIPLYQWYGPPDRREDCPKVVEAARRQLGKMIRRYRNHPSVVFWSVSNETCTQHPEVADANRDLMRLAKELDPTRLAVHVSDHWQPYHDCQDDFTVDDVVCVNGYPDPDSGARWWAEQLERLHRAYPGKPILVTEFGGAYKEGEERQARCVQAGFDGITAPYTCGMLIWCWADHPWPTELEDISLHGLSSFGVLTRERQPRKAAEVARRGFTAARERFAARNRSGPAA